MSQQGLARVGFFSTLIISQNTFKSVNLLPKRGFADSQTHSTVDVQNKGSLYNFFTMNVFIERKFKM